jgi:hypothetical protein
MSRLNQREPSEMLDRIVAQIALALFAWLEKRMERGSTACDATTDDAALRRAGGRVREWMHKNRTSGGGKPDSGGS